MKIPFEYQEKEIDVLGSRFIAIMMPLERFEEIDKCLEFVKEKYPKATHYPYAARYLPNERASDDGEPSRSTGIPLLSLLQQKDVDHIFLCVVRYFGGTKLGVGNLRRCFVEAALDAIHQAEFWTPVERYCYTVCIDYSTYDTLKRLSSRYGFYLEKEKFDERVETRLVSSDKLNKTWEEMGLGAVPLPEPERVTQLEKWSSNDHSK